MRLLIINPNTTHALTHKIESLAQSFLGYSTKITTVSGRFGPRYIASRATFAIACHATIDAYAEHGTDSDCVLLACFGDPGLEALREVCPGHVIGLIDASANEAIKDNHCFSIVTGGHLWKPMLEEALTIRGWSANVASIQSVAPDGGMIARDPEGALKILLHACDRCINQDGAEAIILGGAGLIGMADKISMIRSYPVICSVMAGLRAVKAISETNPRKIHLPNLQRVETIGLSKSLAELLLQEEFSIKGDSYDL